MTGHAARSISRKTNRAVRDHFDAFGGVAARKLVVRENVDGDVAAAFLRDEFGELHCNFGVGGNVRAVDAHDQFDFLVVAFLAIFLRGVFTAARNGKQTAHKQHRRKKFFHIGIFKSAPSVKNPRTILPT